MISAHSSPGKRIPFVIDTLRKAYPEATCALNHKNALQLLVATILSAQCTDNRVNVVTRDIFKKYNTARDYADADPEKFEQEVRSTGFYRNKAKNIRAAARMIAEDFGGRVPDTMEKLITLPGVARKTANVILGTWFHKAEGIAVDTHVHRVSQRLQLTQNDVPEKIEQDLMALIPREEWTDFSHRIIWHGRRVCVARRPRCGECPLAPLCPSAGMFG